MANMRLSTATRNALANQITALVDAGAGAGTLTIYSGTQPASANDAAAGTALVTFTLTDPALGAAAAGVADFDFDPDLSATASATGTATWFRVADSTGATVFDGDVSTTGATLNLSSTAISSGGTVTLATGTVTAPAA